MRVEHGLLVTALMLLAGCTGQERSFLPLRAGEDEDLWAVRCITLRGPQRVQLAKGYEQALKQVKGLRPELVQVFHEAEESTVYYGRYRRDCDVAANRETFRPDPLADLSLIRQLALADRDVWPFRLATMDALPTTQVGNPEWDLNNAAGYWSLQVAVFYNTGEMRRRKQAAAEYCRVLRDAGEEAYYHHGPLNSSVCIGTFPREAIVEVKSEDPLTGVLSFTNKIVDERMLALQKKHPFNYENGYKMSEVVRDPVTGEIQERIPISSFPVRIPRAEKQGLGAAGG